MNDVVLVPENNTAAAYPGPMPHRRRCEMRWSHEIVKVLR